MTSKIVSEPSSSPQDNQEDQSKSIKTNDIPIYRVTLVQEGKVENYRQRLSDSEAAGVVIRAYLADADREHFVVLLLDRRRQVIGINTVSVGSLTATIVHPREVFKPAILANAAAVICGHNHVSGDPRPSAEDRTITRRLVDSGRTLGIEVIDHIIVGEEGYFSFADEGSMNE